MAPSSSPASTPPTTPAPGSHAHARRARAQRVVARLDRLAYFLDNAIAVPGTNYRVGYDAVLGLVPGVGDVVTTGLGLYLFSEAVRLGVPSGVVLKMLGNIAADAAIGIVPGVGDIADFFFKSNARNLALLRAELHRRYELDEARTSAPTTTNLPPISTPESAPSVGASTGPAFPRRRVPNLAG